MLLSRFVDGLCADRMTELAKACIASLPEASRECLVAVVRQRQMHWSLRCDGASGASAESSCAPLSTHVGGREAALYVKRDDSPSTLIKQERVQLALRGGCI